MTLMGLGAFPNDDPLSLDMLGMHGSVYANYAVDQADLLLAFGVRFDDRVTGKVSEFAKHGKIVHIDIDPSEINKNKEAHIPIVSDVKYALAELNKIVEAPEDLSALASSRSPPGRSRIRSITTSKFPGILPQYAIDELWQLTHDRDTIVSVGVGQHQMWAAQYYKFREPQTWLSSSGLGDDGFRPARRDGGQGRPSRQAGRRHRRRRQLPDEHPGTGHLLLRKDCRSRCCCSTTSTWAWWCSGKTASTPATGPTPIWARSTIPKRSAWATGWARHERYPDFVTIAKGFGCGGRYRQRASRTGRRHSAK